MLFMKFVWHPSWIIPMTTSAVNYVIRHFGAFLTKDLQHDIHWKNTKSQFWSKILCHIWHETKCGPSNFVPAVLYHMYLKVCLYITTCTIDHNLTWCIVSFTYPNDLGSASLGSKHAEDASATTNIQHCLALEQVLVVVHGVTVCPRTHLVLQHFLPQQHATRESVLYHSRSTPVTL